MNKNIIKYILISIIIFGIGLIILTSKISWSLYDEEQKPSVMLCGFKGLWSRFLGIRIVIKKDCALM